MRSSYIRGEGNMGGREECEQKGRRNANIGDSNGDWCGHSPTYVPIIR
jgi:hypothetical protein